MSQEENESHFRNSDDENVNGDLSAYPKPNVNVGAPKSRKMEISEPKGNARWKWTDEMVDSLILCLHEHKGKQDYQGKDMEADLVTLYEEIRKMMAEMYPPECFGPAEITEIDRDKLQLDSIQLGAWEKRISNEKKQMKQGYTRIKAKIKLLRQTFKKAVNEGRRSGSGKLIIENWDYLIFIWGGCPSVTQVNGSMKSLLEENSEEAKDDSSQDKENAAEDESDDNESENVDSNVGINVQNSADKDTISSTQSRKRLSDVSNVQASKVSKFVDEKRAKLSKSLSAQQRDQLMVRVAKDKLEVKKQGVEILAESAKSMEKMVSSMSQSITLLGQQLGNGLAMLAQAMGVYQNNQQQMFNHGFHSPPSNQIPNQYNPQYRSTPTYMSMLNMSMMDQEDSQSANSN